MENYRKPLMPIGHVMTSNIDKANTRQALKKQMMDEVSMLEYEAEEDRRYEFEYNETVED